MAKTWQGQHIKKDRGFQQKTTHCKKKEVLKGFCEIAHLKMMVMKKKMMSKTTHLFFPIQQGTTTRRKGNTSTIHVITIHNDNRKQGNTSMIHIKPCIISNDEDVCELAYLKRKVTKIPMKIFNQQWSFSTLCNKKTIEKNKWERNNEEGEK